MNAKQAATLERFGARGGETWPKIATRVATAFDLDDLDEELLANTAVLPSGQIMRNAGMLNPHLASCAVIDAEPSGKDFIDSIVRHVKDGVGVGFNMTQYLSANGAPSGIELLHEVSRRYSNRIPFGRTATGVVIDDEQVDAALFLASQIGTLPELRHFSLSLRVTRRFIEQLSVNGMLGPLSTAIHTWGSPGIIIADNIDSLGGRITAANPCVEQHLGSGETCLLASVNLPLLFNKGVKDGLARTGVAASTAARLLCRASQRSSFPDPDSAELALRAPRIGVGLTGWRSLCDDLEIPFGGGHALALANDISQTISEAAHAEAAEERKVLQLGKEAFAFCTSIAPTGAVSLLAGVSPGISAWREGVPVATCKEQILLVASLQRNVDNGISVTVALETNHSIRCLHEDLVLAADLGVKSLSFFRAGIHLRCYGGG